MTVFQLVSPWLFGLFIVVTTLAVVVHHFNGGHQKIPLTFVIIVGVTLWAGNYPLNPSTPRVIAAVVILSTILQGIMAGVACLVHEPESKA